MRRNGGSDVLLGRCAAGEQPGPSLSVFLTAVHRLRGVNNNYLPVVDPQTGQSRSQTYQFGNETQLTLGVSDRIYGFGLLLDPGLSLLLRRAAADRTNDEVTPSTGGTFLFVQPAVGVELRPGLNWH